MMDFIALIRNPRLQEKLTIAVDGQDAFSQFKNVLLDYPPAREC